MKLLSTAKLLQKLMEFHRLCSTIYKVQPDFNFPYYMDEFNLPSGYGARIYTSGTSSNIKICSGQNSALLMDSTKEAPYNDLINTLWEDNFFRYNYDSPLHRIIYRQKKKELTKAANTFPIVPEILPLEEDILDPFLFQKMTQYSINEAQSIVLESSLRGLRTGLSYGIDYGVLEIITEEDLFEIFKGVIGIYEELQYATST